MTKLKPLPSIELTFFWPNQTRDLSSIHHPCFVITIKEPKHLLRHIKEKHPEEKDNKEVLEATKGWKRLCQFCKDTFADLPKHTKKCQKKKEGEMRKEKEKIDDGLLSNMEFVKLFQQRISRRGEANSEKTAQLYTSKIKMMIKTEENRDENFR